MNKKKQTYAEKHKKSNEYYLLSFLEDVYHNSVAEKFDILFKSSKGFESMFLKLSHTEQLSFVGMLKDLLQSKNQKDRKIAAQKLNYIHEMTGSSYQEGCSDPLFLDEKRLIRMDFYGCINRRRDDQLSPLYKYFCRHRDEMVHRANDYDLQNSPNWKVLRQFQSFRSIEPQIKRYLQSRKMNPDVLLVMTVSDFCDVIYQAVNRDGTEKAHFIEKENCIKNKFVRNFMKKFGKEFKANLLNKNIDERCVNSLCNQMKRFGVCDLDCLVVTEIYHTKRTLKDLQEHGYDVSNVKIGDKIPQKLVNKLVDEDKAHLIAARDADGHLIDKYVLPRLEVHHGYAVKFTDSDSLAMSNYPNNLVLVESRMHQYYYHLFDTFIKQNNMQNFFSHLNIENKNMRMRIGFGREDAVFGDMENTEEFLKRKQEDLLYRVNYYDCQAEYMNNVAMMIRKYDIKINTYGANAYSVMADQLRDFIADKLELTEFKKVVSIKKRKNSGKGGR